ncbi:MAG: portal protein [Bacillota bacterium]
MDSMYPHDDGKDAIVTQAYALFSRFYQQTRTLRDQFVKNEKIWEGRQWEHLTGREPDAPRPSSPVLFSTCESLLADVMDYYPEPVLLGQEPGDTELATELSEVVRYVIKRRNYRKTYREKVRNALIKGTSVQEVFWDRSLYGGLGDVNIREWDVKNFFFDPRCEDIQQGRACFKTLRLPRAWFKMHYPDQEPQMRADAYARLMPGEDESADEEEVLLIEYWYKTRGDGGQSCVHMAKIAGGVLLEDSRKTCPDGLYAHGLYPFIVEPLFRLGARPWGLGIMDIFGPLQFLADRLDQIILNNALLSGKLKLLVDKGADVDMEALTDYSREVVRAGRIDDAAVRWFSALPLNPVVYSHYNGKIQMIKEESGQNQMNRGEGLRNVTAASAIIALQEAGSKRSRLIVQQLYDGFEQLVHMVIELIAQFYTENRRFMVRGQGGDQRMISFNASRMARPDLGQGVMRRHFDFDVRIEAQRQTPVEAAYRNELAMQLLQMSGGLITPVMAIEMMDFEGKERVLAQLRERVLQAGTGEAEPDGAGYGL